MNRLPFSENPNGSYCYKDSTLYFVNTAGQIVELESYETKSEARQVCQHRNNYLDGVGCGATELSEDQIPKQYLPENLDKKAYLKLFTEFMPFPIMTENDYKIVDSQMEAILKRKTYSAEEIDYIAVLASLISVYLDSLPSDT